MTKDDIMDYLQNRKTKEEKDDFSLCMMELLDAIKSEYCTLFVGRDSILEGNQLTLNKSGVELLQNYFNNRVGEHAVIIKNDTLSIGCQNFKIDFIRELIRLQKDGVRTGNNDYLIRIGNIKMVQEAIVLGINITHSGFECKGYDVSIKTVEGWLT